MPSTRRLSAIMFTDMVGSTAAAQSNEAEALRLRDEHEEIVRPVFSAHGGRVVKSMGDGFLVVFDSALRAVQCALDVQHRLHTRNSQAGIPAIRLRIGIHLGDVEERAGDIFGDAVNVAARTEPLAEPGGICISGSVFTQVRNKVPNPIEKMEPRALKGVIFPMDLYRVRVAGAAPEPPPAASGPGQLDQSRIAILPFVSMSPDPSDEYFADGLTDELITNLSLVKGLRVIARTSAMTYKNKGKRVSEIGRELGVGTIVEGSVRKAANRIRVTVQVIDVATEEHLWATRYDRDLDDIFAVQTDIATKVTASLPGALPRSGPPGPPRAGTADTQAYLWYLQGQALVWSTIEAPLRQSLGFFQRAIEKDPMFARAYAGAARAYVRLGEHDVIPWSEAIQRVREAAEKALSINPDLAEAHLMLGQACFMADDFGGTEREARRAVELNPNLAEAHTLLGELAGVVGDLPGYVRHLEEAYRLDPQSVYTIRVIGMAYLYAGREKEALDSWTRTRHIDPMSAHRGMFHYHVVHRDLPAADSEVKEIERIAPTSVLAKLYRGYLAAIMGDPSTTRRMIANLEGTRSQGSAQSLYAGYLYLALGEIDRFFEYMVACAKDRTIAVTTLRYSPLLAAARKDPRFEQLLAPYRRPAPGE